MYLSMVQIENFRSFKELKVEFQEGFNVVVGRNNIGKTNLLHAIRHTLGPNASRGDAIWLERDDFYRESADDKIERTINITLTFAGLSDEQRAYFFEIVDFDLTNLPNSKAIIRFEASWSENKRQPLIKRTGGPMTIDPPEVPTRLLESLPITFLPALRDAEASLAPGVRSRLARLLRDLAKRNSDDSRAEIEDIFRNANAALEQRRLISETKESLQSTTRDIAGSDYFASAIRASDVDFDRILRSLQVQMDGGPIRSLDANGLGYNNLLYMAVVLEHLKCLNEEECPLLLVEEPEAHLHPQLTTLLAEYLATKTPGKRTPQTIVTTHSPTLAASVPPSRVHVMLTDLATFSTRCRSVAAAGMDENEQRELQRMMDITRATLYFAKAAILVEGICETLLLPVLAKRLGHDLSRLHISVIPICGVAFGTFRKLLNPGVLSIPVSIVTDADPPVIRAQNWEEDMPEETETAFQLSDRTTKLLEVFEGHPTVKVFHSQLTLEYDLAEAGDENARVMAEVWENCFTKTPGTFNKARVAAAGCRRDKAMLTWRGICRAEHSRSKAELAHQLATHLGKRQETGQFADTFEVPDYLRQAVEYVVDKLQLPTLSLGAIAE